MPSMAQDPNDNEAFHRSQHVQHPQRPDSHRQTRSIYRRRKKRSVQLCGARRIIGSLKAMSFRDLSECSTAMLYVH